MPSIVNVANMCSHVQNASRARLAITSIKNTKYNLHLALAMHRAGFFSAVYRSGPHPPTLEQMVSEAPEPVTDANASTMRIWLGLKYWKGKPVLSRMETVSKPKCLMTVKIQELSTLTKGFPAQLRRGTIQGLNLGECLFVATSHGILESREALSRHVGGLVMCRVS